MRPFTKGSRAFAACKPCRRRKIKCVKPSNVDNAPCTRCCDKGIECEYKVALEYYTFSRFRTILPSTMEVVPYNNSSEAWIPSSVMWPSNPTYTTVPCSSYHPAYASSTPPQLESPADIVLPLPSLSAQIHNLTPAQISVSDELLIYAPCDTVPDGFGTTLCKQHGKARRAMRVEGARFSDRTSSRVRQLFPAAPIAPESEFNIIATSLYDFLPNTAFTHIFNFAVGLTVSIALNILSLPLLPRISAKGEAQIGGAGILHSIRLYRNCPTLPELLKHVEHPREENLQCNSFHLLWWNCGKPLSCSFWNLVTNNRELLQQRNIRLTSVGASGSHVATGETGFHSAAEIVEATDDRFSNGLDTVTKLEESEIWRVEKVAKEIAGQCACKYESPSPSTPTIRYLADGVQQHGNTTPTKDSILESRCQERKLGRDEVGRTGGKHFAGTDGEELA
ncbi:hypothetical protein C8R45DRAFT_935314 [Mycena sanguinolenta]|nr:hypothetical protein C8R45DRAFT_935314 [Mycena sanguinolenta]